MNSDDRGERIKQARKKAHLSQKELGDRLGVTQAMISAYEQGVRKPKLETMQKIATALGISEQELLGYNNSEYVLYKALEGSDPDEQNNSLVINGVLVSEKNLLRQYRELNRIGKAEAIKRVKELKYIPEFTGKDDIPFD